ncbi:hypothetical protein [Microbacterium halotolerans]|uniref:hypothetical protein n=1 Tax=Microbacterium halotolerans TaxID=246613 RepID=UPI0013C33A2B|nr:hypothetical protein [Microbacterium halotolerans]
MPVDDETREAAKADLDRAIKAYFGVIEPDTYVDAWVLVTHKRRPEWEQAGQSVVGTTTPPQAWPLTRGLLDIALTEDRDDQSVRDGEDD